MAVQKLHTQYTPLSIDVYINTLPAMVQEIIIRGCEWQTMVIYLMCKYHMSVCVHTLYTPLHLHFMQILHELVMLDGSYSVMTVYIAPAALLVYICNWWNISYHVVLSWVGLVFICELTCPFKHASHRRQDVKAMQVLSICVCKLRMTFYAHSGQCMPLMGIMHALDWVHSVLVNKLKVALHGS